MGGVPVILPMFVPASSEVSVSHLPALAPRPLPSRAYAQAFSLLAILLQEDPSQLVTFKNNGGVQLLAILLRRCPPSHLSVELVTVIQQIVEALKRDPELYIDGVRYLLFDFSVWGSAPWQTHVVVLRLLSDVVSQDPLMVKNHVGIRPLLQALVKIYYSEVSEYSCKRDESFAEDLVGELQTSVVEMIRMMLDAESSAYRVDVSYLLSVLYMVDDPDIVLPILQLFYDFMMACSLLFFCSLTHSRSQAEPLPVARALQSPHRLPQVLLQRGGGGALPRHPLSPVLLDRAEPRGAAVRGDQRVHGGRVQRDRGLLVGQQRDAGRVPGADGLHAVAEGRRGRGAQAQPGSVAKGVVDGRRPLAIQNPFAFNILIEALCNAKDAVRDAALSHVLSLVQGVTSATANRLVIAQSVGIGGGCEAVDRDRVARHAVRDHADGDHAREEPPGAGDVAGVVHSGQGGRLGGPRAAAPRRGAPGAAPAAVGRREQF